MLYYLMNFKNYAANIKEYFPNNSTHLLKEGKKPKLISSRIKK